MLGRVRHLSAFGAMIMIIALLVGSLPMAAFASAPSSGTLNPPAGNGTTAVTWSGGPYTVATPDPALCVDSSLNCDTFNLALNVPSNYWDTHEGNVTVEINWASSSDDFDLYVQDSQGHEVGRSAAGGTTSEKADLGKLAPGTYKVQVVAYLTAAASYTGKATLTSTELSGSMAFPETKDTVKDLLTVDYPLNVIFVGYTPTAAEVAELRKWIPDNYQPTVATKSPGGDEVQNAGAGLLNWNKDHLISSAPYFLGIRYNYKLNIIQASQEYAQALFQVAEDNTAQAQAFKTSSRGQDLARYDTLYGQFRLQAKGGDLAYKVLDPTKTDLIDAYAVEDWIFNSRSDAKWNCAFKNLETGACLNPSIIQPDAGAYYDPYYDKNGLNLDRMPQGLNKGSSFFFLDTFTPSYANQHFRSNAYHTWGTDKVINGQIIQKPIEAGGSWRITDPDTKDWDGVDFARTWGGRYRFHFIDLGAAPNNYESASWLKAERTLSSDYPHGDPPIWQYKADPQWQQTTDNCTDAAQVNYTGGTPCRMMPRLGRDVAYGLFFRSTSGYLYRPIPRGDVYWLAVSNWTDFYSRPQWVNGQLTSAPWYGTWWTNTDKLYKINQAGNNNDDTMRWLSSALPYARWVGRKGEVIPLYDPTNNQPTGKTLDTSPKYEDLPAPKYHVEQSTTGTQIAAEPLYPGDDKHVHAQYGSSTVDLTEVSNALEKAKAQGVAGTYDDSVNHEAFRDFIDAHREGIADIVPGVNTIPSINMVFEKAYTWALPAIVGGIAVGTADGEAWGVMNNVNDRFKWSESHYPPVTSSTQPGTPASMPVPATPQQQAGGGFSYTIEHEAAHNLGLSHPHDGSYGVDRCPKGSPNAGKWECYWTGLGWMYDVAAAPTTYAMSYRPYEVEDQDNLQRGHVAEYLVGAQDALRERLVAEAKAGRSTPSTEWTNDFNRMKQWRAQAADLFRQGDYLHAEYAARNAALAARGIAQTASNTSNPKLLEAGQVFYFNVNPQGAPAAKPDLTITAIATSYNNKTKTRVLTATVTNTGTADAGNVIVQFANNSTVIGNSTALATLAKGTSAQVQVTWNVGRGTYTITASADPSNTVAESNENNNTKQQSLTVK
jgi:hypothetical protein